MLFPPLPEIAVVESLLLEVGIDAILSRQVERVSPARLRQAAKLPAEIRALAGKMVKGKLEPAIPRSDLDWRQAVADLAAGWNVEQVIQTCRAFPQEYQAAASALVIKSQALIKELSEGLPLDRYQTFAGSKELIPSDSHINRFACVLEVIRDPLVIFPLMSGGMLLRIQANAVREQYPTLSAAIDAAIFQATAAAKAVKKTFELPYRVEFGVRTWMGQAPIPQPALRQSQQNVAKMNQRKQPQTPPAVKPASSLMTTGQRAEAKGMPTP